MLNTMVWIVVAPVELRARLRRHESLNPLDLTLEQRMEVLLSIVRNGHRQVDARLREKYLTKGGFVSHAEPGVRASVLLLLLSFSDYYVVKPLGTGNRRRKPDLLVGGLLVDDVRANRRERDG